MKLLIFFLLSMNISASNLPKQFKIVFEQKYKSKLNNKEKKSSGVLMYSNPKKIRIEIEKPDMITFVSNGEKSWYYRGPFIEGEPGEVIINQGGENLNLLANFFDLLQKGIESNKIYDVEKKSSSASILFKKEYVTKYRLKSVTLNFEDSKQDLNKLKSMQLTYEDGEMGNFEISSIEPKSYDQKNFEFVIPPNTKISK